MSYQPNTQMTWTEEIEENFYVKYLKLHFKHNEMRENGTYTCILRLDKKHINWTIIPVTFDCEKRVLSLYSGCRYSFGCVSQLISNS